MKPKLACQIKVRSYPERGASLELDAYGHVNHAVFLNYFEQARAEYLEQRGISFQSLWREGFFFVIARAEVDYLKPLALSDRIEISGEIASLGSTSVILIQEITKLPDKEPVCRGTFVAVFLDRQTLEPVGVPNSFRKAFLPERGGSR